MQRLELEGLMGTAEDIAVKALNRNDHRTTVVDGAKKEKIGNRAFKAMTKTGVALLLEQKPTGINTLTRHIDKSPTAEEEQIPTYQTPVVTLDDGNQYYLKGTIAQYPETSAHARTIGPVKEGNFQIILVEPDKRPGEDDLVLYYVGFTRNALPNMLTNGSRVSLSGQYDHYETANDIVQEIAEKSRKQKSGRFSELRRRFGLRT